MELKNIIITDITDWPKLAKWLEDNTDCRWAASGAPTNFNPFSLNEIRINDNRIITYSNDSICYRHKEQWRNYTFITQSEFEAKYMNTKSYQERQDEWIKANNLKIGDKVKVIREAKNYEDGWKHEWVKFMAVKQTLIVIGLFEDSVQLSDRYLYPYFCLEKVEEVKESKEKTIEEWLNELPEPYRTQALNNTSETKKCIFRKNICDTLMAAFFWTDFEGHAYWEPVYKHYSQGTPLPKPIENYTSITEAPNPISIKVTEDSVYEEWKNLILN